MKQKREDKYKLWISRREEIYVHDEPHHSLSIVEMEGEPIDHKVGVAGEFVSRRSVTFHDRTRGEGPMQGYVHANFQYGAVYSRFEGQRDARTKISTGTWKTYKGTGKLTDIKGEGTFKLYAGDRPGEFIMEMEGEYEAG